MTLRTSVARRINMRSENSSGKRPCNAFCDLHVTLLRLGVTLSAARVTPHGTPPRDSPPMLLFLPFRAAGTAAAIGVLGAAILSCILAAGTRRFMPELADLLQLPRRSDMP